jgi:hypothetical protein
MGLKIAATKYAETGQVSWVCKLEIIQRTTHGLRTDTAETTHLLQKMNFSILI